LTPKVVVGVKPRGVFEKALMSDIIQKAIDNLYHKRIIELIGAKHFA
jgi:hypothetical protein